MFVRLRRLFLQATLAASAAACSSGEEPPVPVVAQVPTIQGVAEPAPSPREVEVQQAASEPQPEEDPRPALDSFTAVVQQNGEVLTEAIEDVAPEQVFRVKCDGRPGFRAMLEPVMRGVRPRRIARGMVDCRQVVPRRFWVQPLDEDEEGLHAGDRIVLEPLGAIPGFVERSRKPGVSDVAPRGWH